MLSQSTHLQDDCSSTEIGAAQVKPFFSRDTVISSGADGSPVSMYGDHTWNCAWPGKVEQYETLRFHSGPTPLDALLREQSKGLMWCHIDKGKIRSILTIRYANYAVRKWCDIAKTMGIDLFRLLRDPVSMGGYLSSLNVNYVNQTSAIVKTLSRHRDRLLVGDEVPVRHLKTVLVEEVGSREAYRQTPLIPSRIYLAILSRLVLSLDRVEKDLDEAIPRYIASAEKSKKVAFAATECDAEGIPVNVKDRLTYYQTQLMLCLVAFSGMRKGEAASLRLAGCLREFEDGGSTHYEICGFTTKFNKGLPRHTSWITSREGARAVRIAKRISEAVMEKHGVGVVDKAKVYLFPALENPSRGWSDNLRRFARVAAVTGICPTIEQSDIDELNGLELERGWQRDGIEAGSAWPLTFHQLRRSLSVYAHRSGMVSLPGLKAQLQHITDEMRAYYSDGFSRAANLVFDKDHFSHEWNASKAESSFFGYTLRLLLEESEVFGRGAERMSGTLSSRTREESLKLFEKGQIAYRETVLGGCTALEKCDSTPLAPIPFECVQKNCVNQVVVGKRLDHVIGTQEVVVATLVRDPDSVEYRLEASNLRVLLEARDRFRS